MPKRKGRATLGVDNSGAVKLEQHDQHTQYGQGCHDSSERSEIPSGNEVDNPPHTVTLLSHYREDAEKPHLIAAHLGEGSAQAS